MLLNTAIERYESQSRIAEDGESHEIGNIADGFVLRMFVCVCATKRRRLRLGLLFFSQWDNKVACFPRFGLAVNDGKSVTLWNNEPGP